MKIRQLTFIKFILTAIIMLVLTSCSESYSIKIQENGIADLSYELHYLNKDSVKQSYSTEKELKQVKDSLSKMYARFFKNKLITNYKCSINNDLEVKIFCKISNVNKLGQFLCPLSKPNHPITINYTTSKLTIDAGQGESKAEDDIGGLTDEISFKLNLELPRKIKSVNNESGIPSKYSENKFTLESSIGGLNYSNRRNKITIEY